MQIRIPASATVAAIVIATAACSGGRPALERQTGDAPATGVVAADVIAPPRPATLAARPQRHMVPASQEVAGVAGAAAIPPHGWMPVDRESYAHLDDHPLRRAAEHPLSTFAVDVDTASYANVRRMLNEGRLPPDDAVRTEELINYFRYDDGLPASKEKPFHVSTEVGTTPWNPNTRLLRIGITTWRRPTADLPPASLVFLVDVSGSMRSPDKLPLLKNAMRLLTRQLDGDDRIAMAVYAGAAGVVLEPTTGDRAGAIEQAISRLEAGGSTNGGDGIRLAYAMARQAYIENGINRVILATDGDFNVGTVDHHALVDMVERERDNGISLTVLGFGGGNLNDHLMEQLADRGNGNYAYIDGLQEARKVLVAELGATLETVAADVKVQVEFNPAVVAEYRLIGYENRVLAREDFNNDRVDAGDIGAGHSVTALYELALTGSGGERIDPLRYESPQRSATATGDELAWLRLRYKRPGATASELVEQAVTVADTVGQGSRELRFAAAVAAFGQALRGGKYLEGFGFKQIATLARDARGEDADGHRAGFVNLVELAASLQATARASGIDAAQAGAVTLREASGQAASTVE
jgi:Ca-activated chloride channel family protein